ncbi:1-acyl-sn-glycerol-3-phosphate acyltransferase [Candidatus Woesearchaeota archaeon]|nr:1-acyl-sn-glycerol-3-phosphate acyltransferase [Candidatus Woesearchaeota archaeon]
MLYPVLSFFIANFCKLFIKEIKGIKNLPEGGFIIASNHASFLDPSLICSILLDKFHIKVHYLGKKELFETFLGKIFHEATGTIPIDRRGKDKSGLEKAINHLKKGGVIGIFPEGTRSEDGKLQDGKTGVARLAIGSQVPVIPVGIRGTYDVWPRQKKLFRLKRVVEVNFGKPIYFDKYYTKQDKATFKKTTKIIMKRIAKLLE